MVNAVTSLTSLLKPERRSDTPIIPIYSISQCLYDTNCEQVFLE
jgi:hypothetical protein